MSTGKVLPPARLRPELLDDVAEGVGHDFTRVFFAAVARVVRQPDCARVVYAGFRRVRLRRFPYSLYYRGETTETVFFLLFHAARDPATMRDTLRGRRADS